MTLALVPERLAALAASGRLPFTPAYVYDAAVLRGRVAALRGLFGDLFRISYAIKSNPNPAVLRIMAAEADHLDASSWAEVIRALEAGGAPRAITWSGPGKRLAELRALAAPGRARGVALVAEGLDEIDDIARLSAEHGVVQDVLIRINPDHVPRGFGASMSGKPSQFGIDEAAVPEAVAHVDAQPALRLAGFHVYTGSNCLSADAIVENFANMARLFRELSRDGTRVLDKLIFGAGFGLPYHAGQADLDVAAVRAGIAPLVAGLRALPGLAGAAFVLELGRWLSGPAGALVTEVLAVKDSRGQRIAVCDAGFNNHLAACGMMGSVFRKDYPIANLTGAARPPEEVRLTGPLCTSIDALAGPLPLPRVARGDRLAVMLSGAYGLTASPTRFISHPDPVELMLDGDSLRDVSETAMNHVLP